MNRLKLRRWRPSAVQHYWFDDGADLYCHLGDSPNERIEKHHADAKVVGDGLPGDPPFRHTHDNFNVSGELGVLCRPQAREAGRTGFLNFPDRRDELRKLFKFQTAAKNFRDRSVHDDGSAVGIHVDQDRRSIASFSRSQWSFGNISSRTWLFLVLSGLATGLSWLCYFRALQLGEASRVAPMDKLSVLFAIILAAVVLRENVTWHHGWAAALF